LTGWGREKAGLILDRRDRRDRRDRKGRTEFDGIDGIRQRHEAPTYESHEPLNLSIAPPFLFLMLLLSKLRAVPSPIL
jgi:hypothetical protein